jgi:hypothetical protein
MRRKDDPAFLYVQLRKKPQQFTTLQTSYMKYIKRHKILSKGDYTNFVMNIILAFIWVVSFSPHRQIPRS